MNRAKGLSDGNGTHLGWIIWCPGCKEHHRLDQCWIFNGNLERPTFSPSLLINHPDGRRCHSFVTNGRIEFLADCTHELKGQVVELEGVD